uniref:Calponin-homology (CH) domain-containing protein n=1 Tax=Haemonchus placei TaxID=6290 RepID=A0A0N4W0G3_HAEPC
LLVSDYSTFQGKLAASIRWLILRVYEQEKDIPDKLRRGAFRDERGHLQLDIAILTGLTNGSLYCQAAAKIFKEPQLVTQSHGAVIAALTDYGIDVLQCSDGGTSPVTEAELFASDSFNMSAHLAMMDALMSAHLRNLITVDRVIEAVSRHTSVDESERPVDSVDALLFWINKVCLLVRDDVERGGMIPEMEDLYDEISDGQCLCTLVAWYRPREMEIEDICYNDQMSTSHCHYNLLLLQRFCLNCLPWNPFHFEIEDILYLHDSLQMNINVFLADLFEIFEPAPTVVAQPESVTSPRRFVPVQGIPDLRAANSAARNPYPPRVRNPFNNVHVTSTPPGVPTAIPSRSISMMSQDSLLTNSFRVNILIQPDDGSNGNLSTTGCSPYARSDSLPIASIRLALQEKRRDHEKRKALMRWKPILILFLQLSELSVNLRFHRVDPPLEINRNLTNWGMTYQKGHTGRPQRRTWENQTFIKSEHDLVNQPDLVPTVPSDDVRTTTTTVTMPNRCSSTTIVDQIEQRNAEKRMAELAKRELAEQRKLEKELQRQKILDDYKRRKMEKELGLESGSSSARGASGRGHSQPPFIRTKSQVMSWRLPRARGQSTVEQRISVQSLQEPTHKLFARATPKSNRGLIINALQYSVFPGAVNDTTRMKTMNDLAASDAKHFLVLFRDYKCQYRGLYSWDQVSDTAIKISGQGPSKCTESIMKLMFKYDSGAKNFSQIPTKHLGATIDGFTIQDQFWQKPKIPHSGAASHRNN